MNLLAFSFLPLVRLPRTLLYLIAIGVTLLLFRKRLPGLIERLDDHFTNKLKPARRARIISRWNAFLESRFVWWLVERILRKVSKDRYVRLEGPRHKQTQKTERLSQNPETISSYKWTNWLENQAITAHRYHDLNKPLPEAITDLPPPTLGYDYETLRQLVFKVKMANDDDLPLKPVASGHAYSDVALTSGVMIETRGLTSPQRLVTPELLTSSAIKDYEFSTPVDQFDREKRYLFEVGAGIKIKALSHYLDQLNLALINQGGTDVQGIMGAISTSTHGSGIDLPPFPDMVRSMVMVRADQQVIRLEPTNGVTDPKKYKESEAFVEHGITLVQDDDLFYSCLVSMGCMGIVYSVILEVRERYFLKEERTLTTWEDLKKDLQEEPEKVLGSVRHYELSINPYPAEGGDHAGKHTCLVTTRGELAELPVQTPRAAGSRNFIADFFSGLSLTAPLTVWLYNLRPACIPRMIDNSLKRLQDNCRDGEGFYGKSTEVLNQGLEKLRATGFAIEVCLPLDRFTEGIDHIIEIIGEAAANRGIYNPGPLAIRFVGKSKARLSMMYGRATCTVEVISLKGIEGADELLTEIEEQMFFWESRPHWGLNQGCISHKKGRLQSLYPESFDGWLASVEQMDPKGKFESPFTQKCEFRQLIAEKKKLKGIKENLHRVKGEILARRKPEGNHEEIAEAVQEIESTIDTWYEHKP